MGERQMGHPRKIKNLLAYLLYFTYYTHHTYMYLQIKINHFYGIIIKQAGALHRPIVVCHLTHEIYHLDYSRSLSAMFIQNWTNPMMQWAKCERSKLSGDFLYPRYTKYIGGI